MRPLILILLFVGFFQSLTGQTNSKHVKLYKPKSDSNCFYEPKYSAIQRNRFYPFNVADTIKLISFRYHRRNYSIKRDTILLDSLIEIKTLKKDETSNLTDILYNNFYKKQPVYGSLTECFFPRNAILFLDKSGHLKEYILICFHCNRHEESSNKIIFGDNCLQKMEKLREFFVSIGLKFGTNKTVEMYQGEEGDDTQY